MILSSLPRAASFISCLVLVQTDNTHSRLNWSPIEAQSVPKTICPCTSAVLRVAPCVWSTLEFWRVSMTFVAFLNSSTSSTLNEIKVENSANRTERTIDLFFFFFTGINRCASTSTSTASQVKILFVPVDCTSLTYSHRSECAALNFAMPTDGCLNDGDRASLFSETKPNRLRSTATFDAKYESFECS